MIEDGFCEGVCPLFDYIKFNIKDKKCLTLCYIFVMMWLTNIGKVISMISSFLGIAIVALPSGIIISGYQEALHDYTKSETE